MTSVISVEKQSICNCYFESDESFSPATFKLLLFLFLVLVYSSLTTLCLGLGFGFFVVAVVFNLFGFLDLLEYGLICSIRFWK